MIDRIATQAAAFSMALAVTVSVFAGINGLATHEAGDAQPVQQVVVIGKRAVG